MKMVIDDGARLADALEAVTKDPSLKESFFTTPLALHSLQSLSSPLKYHKGKGKAKGFGVQPDGTQPPPAPHQQQRPTKGGKGKGKLNGQVLATKTPYDSATLLSSRRNMLCANMFSSLFFTHPARPGDFAWREQVRCIYRRTPSSRSASWCTGFFSVLGSAACMLVPARLLRTLLSGFDFCWHC